MTQGDTAPIAVDDLEALRTALSASVRCANAVLAEHDFEPALGSEASLEMSEDSAYDGTWGRNCVFETWALAFGLLVEVEDHLRGLELLLRPDGDTAYPQMVVARSALECSARAWWLCQPGIGTRARIARGKNEWIYSREQEKRLGIEKVSVVADTRLAEIFAGAAEHGFAVGRTERGGCYLVEGGQRPGATLAVANLIPSGDVAIGRTAFNLYSAVDHGTAFGVYQAFEGEEVDEVDDEYQGSRVRGSLVRRPTTTAVLAAMALHGYLKARHVHIVAYGRSGDAWVSWMRHAFAAMQRVIGSPEATPT